MDKHYLLHPPLPVKKLEKKDEVLLITCIRYGKFEVVFLDAHFEELSKSMEVPVNDFSKFLDSSTCQNLKAVIFLLVDYDYMSQITYQEIRQMVFVTDLEIRQMVYKEVTKRKLHIYLVHSKTLSIMSTVFSSKIDSKLGDVILNVSSVLQMVTVSELQRKQEGYSCIGFRMIDRNNKNVNDVASEILGTCNPKYITVFDPEDNDLSMLLKSRVVTSKKVFNNDIEGIAGCAPQVRKTIFERGNNQLIPFCMDMLVVTNESNLDDVKEAVITVEIFEELPFEKVQIVPKSDKPYCVKYFDTISKSYKPAGEALISKEQEGHRIKLALVVDRNSLPFLYQETFILPEIEALPKHLSSRPNLNVPVIGFYDKSSVICVRDENGYMLMNEWNGLYGNDLYLSFEPEEPTIVTDVNKVKNKDPFVVYDLVKVLSMPADNLKVDPKWGFKVISNSEHPVLLEHDTFLGIRKVATPVFMVALLLKHHIKAIKKETGKKPKELGFCLFNDFTNEEKKRIQNGLKEACKLLKIGSVFVTNV